MNITEFFSTPIWVENKPEFLKSLNKAQKKIQKMSYLDPLISGINSSTTNNFYQFKAAKTDDFFSF